MRRSGSQLSNLSNYAGRRGYGAAAAGQNAGALHYADEIQRRIDALGLGGEHLGQPIMPGQQFGHVGLPQMPMHPQPVQAAPEYYIPAFQQPPYAPAFPHPAQAAPIQQPVYANFPAPADIGQAHNEPQEHRASTEINSIRKAIQSLTEKLSVMQTQQAQTAKNVSAKSAQSQELERCAKEIAALRTSMEEAKEEIKTTASSPVLDPEVYARVIKTSHSDLAVQIEEMRKSLGELSPAPVDTDMFQRTIEASHDELKAQIEHLQNSLNSGQASGGVDKEHFEASHDQVLNQLGEIQSLLLANESNQNSLTAFDNLEMRLEEITRAVVALSHSDQATDSIERVEARINELSRLIGGMESGVSSFVSGDAQLSHRLDEIAQRLDAMSELSQASNTGFEADNNNLAALQEISERLEQLDSKVQSVQGAGEFGQLLSNPEILENLKQLSNSAEALNSKTNEGVQTESIEKLEADVGHIISILEKAPLNNDESADYVEFTKKLSSIEEQLASNRDISIEMATQVAQDTVEQVMAQVGAGSGMESTESSALSILSGLSEDIHKLQEASTHTNSQNLDAFSAIKDTLGSMVERLSTLEQDATVQAQVTAQPTPEYTAPAPAEPVIQQEVTEPVPVLNEPVEEEVPSIPSIDEFDEPVRLGGVQKEEKATGQDMVAEYRALVSEKKEVEVKPEPQQVSVAQSLVEEAARAEEERKKLRASMNPAASGDRESAGAALVENDREFHSAEMAIETFDEEDVLPPLPVAETPELTTPTPLEDSPSIDVDVEVEDRPLEPGSAGPDLAALVRKANETRKNRSKKGEGSSGTDFIAAARRAAQAAAEEASAAHDEVVKQEKESGKSVLGSIPGLFSRRKKVISMAAVATLLAAMSVPLIISAFNPGENHRLVEVNDENTVVETVKDETKVEPLVNAPRVVEAAPEPLDEPRISVASLGGIQSGETDTMRSSTSIDTRTWLEDLTYVNDALKKAVAEAQVEAIYEVGRRHLEGIGVEKSAGKALEWYMRAAELGYAPAQYIVANLNEKAIGVQRNIPEAMKWYEKAAASGNVVSMHNLAVLNATPNPATGEPDTATAFKWFKKAAEFGVRDSLVNLGIFYTKGVGTEVDLVEAYKWFTLAGKAGDEDAVKKREVVAEYMRPDQLELAKSRIEDWRPAEKNITANVYAPDPSWQPAVASAPIDDSPEAVKKAQTLLGRLGYDAGPADGIMGARTKQAIAEFQQRVGLSVSGELSTELLSELEAVAI